jgi:hypothetical protein
MVRNGLGKIVPSIVRQMCIVRQNKEDKLYPLMDFEYSPRVKHKVPNASSSRE